MQAVEWILTEFDLLSPRNLYEIMKLRQEVFIVEQNCPYLDADSKDFFSHHLLGFISQNNDSNRKQLAAYARIVQPGISYEEVSIGRVVTSNQSRHTGLGKQLMHEALQCIRNLYGEVPIRIGAQSYLLKFYSSFGFVPLENYMEDGIPHTIMLRMP